MITAGVTHAYTLYATPAWQTDKQIAAGLKMGRVMNALNHSPPPRAGTTAVPLANADTLSSRAYLDLSKGPLVLSGLRPDMCTYWSASLFAHDTDTVFVQSDRDTPDRVISIGIRLVDQAPPANVAHDVVMPSKTGVLLIRCFMSDRTNQTYIAELTAQQKGLLLHPPLSSAASSFMPPAEAAPAPAPDSTPPSDVAPGSPQ